MSIQEKLIDGLTASFARIQQNRVEVCDSVTCVNRCKEKTEGEKAFAAAAAANYVAAQINRQLSEPAGEDTGKSEANQPDGKQSGFGTSGEEMEREAAQVANLIAVTGKTELEREEAANQPDGKPRHNHIYVCL